MSRALAVLLPLVVLSGCTPMVDSFSIRRFSATAWSEFPPLERIVTDREKASRLYLKVLALPRDPLPEGRFCNLDMGLRYDLIFFAKGDRVLHAVATRGCPGLDLGAGDHRLLDESFWAQLAGDLGYYTRGNDLFPTPIPRQ